MRAITTHQYLWETVPLLFLLCSFCFFGFSSPSSGCSEPPTTPSLPFFVLRNCAQSLSNLHLSFPFVQVLRLEAHRAAEEGGDRYQPAGRAGRRHGPEAEEPAGKAVILVH